MSATERPTHLHYAAVLLGNRREFYLQRRDDRLGVAYPGRLGLFGGARRGDEDARANARREVLEETGIDITLEEADLLCRVEDRSLTGFHGRGHIYWRELSAAPDSVFEGRLVTCRIEDIGGMFEELTPGAAYAVLAARDRLSQQL